MSRAVPLRLDSIVRTNKKFPRVSRRVTANLTGYFTATRLAEPFDNANLCVPKS